MGAAEELDELLNNGAKSGAADSGDEFAEYGGFKDDKPQESKPVSEGDHLAQVQSAKMVDASEGQRNYGAIRILEIQWRIIDGDDKKRVIYERISLKHQDAEAVQRARGIMGEIRLALGLNEIPNAGSLVGKQCMIKVKHSVPKKHGDPVYANIRGHKAIPEGTVVPGKIDIDGANVPF